LREKEGTAAAGGGRMRVFFFVRHFGKKKEEDPHPTLSRKRERASEPNESHA
jgi:hypothetical protein